MSFQDLSPSNQSKLLGAGLMLGWALSFSTIMSLAKTLSPELNSLTILFMRYFFGFVFFSPFILRAGVSGFKTSRLFLHLTRVACIGGSMLCAYYAYRNLPLVLATSVGMTSPLFTTLFAMIILKDPVSLRKWGAIIFGYLGVLVMVQPHELPIGPGVYVAILANILAALAIICVKILSRTESTLTIMLYVNTVTTFVAGLCMLGFWQVPSQHDFLVLSIIGALGVFSQYCLVTAMKHAEPSYLTPLEYTRLCFAIPVGYLLFDEIPTFWVIVGSLMIIAATYLLTRFELKESLTQQEG